MPAIALMDNPAIELEELMQIVPGPDFPTGGMILGRPVSARLTPAAAPSDARPRDIEEIRKDREAIIVTEIPIR
jgi:DNA gyrase subunit A